jgi:hypothetical protein
MPPPAPPKLLKPLLTVAGATSLCDGGYGCIDSKPLCTALLLLLLLLPSMLVPTAPPRPENDDMPPVSYLFEYNSIVCVTMSLLSNKLRHYV